MFLRFMKRGPWGLDDKVIRSKLRVFWRVRNRVGGFESRGACLLRMGIWVLSRDWSEKQRLFHLAAVLWLAD